jgi:hypothetical protein
MKVAKKVTRNTGLVMKVARSVSFDEERLSDKRQISKDRRRYIQCLSTKALTAISA